MTATPTPPGARLTASGTHGIAAPHPLAAAAGEDVLRHGGNAVDAAVAAAAVLTVALPNQCALGGDLIALVGRPDGSVHVLNASGRAPATVDVDATRAAHGRMPVDGATAVTVPGVVDGWHELTQRWGTRPVRAALATASALARDGLPVNAGLARDIVREGRRILADPGLSQVLAPGGQLLDEGSVLRQPALAQTLERIAADGRDAFYRGHVADSLVRLLRAHGSAMTPDDFAAHHSTLEAPLAVRFADEEYLSSGGNTQGGYFLAGLHALGSRDMLAAGRLLDPLGPQAGRLCRLLAAVAHERDLGLGGSQAAIPLDAQGLRALADKALGAGPGSGPGSTPGPHPTGDTVAVVAADSAGGWVSLIQSVFHAFGAALLDPVTGVLLHNRGAAFTLEPDRPGSFAGARRPPHTLMPVLVRDPITGYVIGAHGSMGGRAQPQIHTHLALHLASGRTPGEAVAAPRWIVGDMEAGGVTGDVIQAEADLPHAARRALGDLGLPVHTLSAHDDGVGHAQVVRVSTTGPQGSRAVTVASDPRAGGAALADLT